MIETFWGKQPKLMLRVIPPHKVRRRTKHFAWKKINNVYGFAIFGCFFDIMKVSFAGFENVQEPEKLETTP